MGRLAKQAIPWAKECLGGEGGLALFKLPTQTDVDGRLPDSATKERRVKTPYPELFNPISTMRLLPSFACGGSLRPLVHNSAWLDAAS